METRPASPSPSPSPFSPLHPPTRRTRLPGGRLAAESRPLGFADPRPPPTRRSCAYPPPYPCRGLRAAIKPPPLLFPDRSARPPPASISALLGSHRLPQPSPRPTSISSDRARAFLAGFPSALDTRRGVERARPPPSRSPHSSSSTLTLLSTPSASSPLPIWEAACRLPLPGPFAVFLGRSFRHLALFLLPAR